MPRSGPRTARHRSHSTAAPVAATTTPVPSRIAPVGNAATSTKPVAKVATIAPAVPIPDSRPTTVPVCRRSCSCSLATIGVTADSSAAGATTATIASSRVAEASPLPRVASPVKRTTGRVSSVSAAATSSSGPSSRPGSVRSADPAAGPGADRDRGQRGTDDRRVGLQGDPDVRGDQPQRQDLQHQHGRGRHEDDERREPRRQRHPPRAGPARLGASRQPPVRLEPRPARLTPSARPARVSGPSRHRRTRSPWSRPRFGRGRGGRRARVLRPPGQHPRPAGRRPDRPPGWLRGGDPGRRVSTSPPE